MNNKLPSFFLSFLVKTVLNLPMTCHRIWKIRRMKFFFQNLHRFLSACGADKPVHVVAG